MPDLQEIAKQHESEELANIKFTLDSVSDFDKLLLEAYSAQCPKPIDYFNRRDLIRIFNIIAKEIYGNLCSKVPPTHQFCTFTQTKDHLIFVYLRGCMHNAILSVNNYLKSSSTGYNISYFTIGEIIQCWHCCAVSSDSFQKLMMVLLY